MFKPKRQLNISRGKEDHDKGDGTGASHLRVVANAMSGDGVTLDKAGDVLKSRFSGEQVMINGQKVNLHERIEEIRKAVESVGMSTHTRVADLKRGTQGIARNGYAILDIESAISHPKFVPHIVAHEGAHLGVLAITKNKPIHNEALADRVAAIVSGQTMSSDYDQDLEALMKIATAIDVADGELAGDEMILDYYINDKLTLLLQYYIEISMKNARLFSKKKAVARALEVFGKAFPECKVTENLADETEVAADGTHDAVSGTLNDTEGQDPDTQDEQGFQAAA